MYLIKDDVIGIFNGIVWYKISYLMIKKLSNICYTYDLHEVKNIKVKGRRIRLINDATWVALRQK
jgi:hypothetical protein